MEKCNGTNGDKNGTRKENRNSVVWARFCHQRTIVVVVVVAKDVVMSMVKYLVSEKSNKQYKKTYHP